MYLLNYLFLFVKKSRKYQFSQKKKVHKQNVFLLTSNWLQPLNEQHSPNLNKVDICIQSNAIKDFRKFLQPNLYEPLHSSSQSGCKYKSALKNRIINYIAQ